MWDFSQRDMKSDYEAYVEHDRMTRNGDDKLEELYTQSKDTS